MSYASTLLRSRWRRVFGDVAIYLMINPTKASYSMAPTMMVCALAGFFTAKSVRESAASACAAAMLVGLLIGLAVNFRLPNLFLSAGYFLYLAFAFLDGAKPETLLQGGHSGWHSSWGSRRR